mmetsp:Transcript_26800/g.40519  ORF Transcript_26800/g.40519 Transcript_26800/m.40519 type:complete len:249 (+) Transcript_26800:105-851(+)
MILSTHRFSLSFLAIILMSSSINSLATNNKMMATRTKEHTNSVLANLSSHGMEKKELPHHNELRRASVLVPLFERPIQQQEQSSSNLHVLFTQRPQKMKSHGGEVCFPGGKQDAEDNGCDVTTALREAHEEVGLNPDHVQQIARMEAIESKHSLCVTPIVGLIQPPSAAEPSQLTLNEHEVEAAFAVPLEYFTITENLASIQKIKYGANGEFLMRTYLFDDPESGRQFRIWGLTAHVVHEVAQLAFSR